MWKHLLHPASRPALSALRGKARTGGRVHEKSGAIQTSRAASSPRRQSAESSGGGSISPFKKAGTPEPQKQ